jgi:hypothetical protein
MSDQQFDHKMRQALEQIEAPFDPQSWDALSRKLDNTAAPATDATDAPNAFDQRMRERLEGVQPRYQTTHWDMLAQRLDSMAHVARIRKHKAAEAVLMLLLLANLQLVFKGGTQLFHMPMPAIQPAVEQPIAAAQHGKSERTRTNAAAPLVAQDMDVEMSASLSNSASTATIWSQVLSALGAGSDISTPQNSNTTVATTDANPTGGGLARAMIGPDGRPITPGLRPLTLLQALGLDRVHSQTVQPIAGIQRNQDISTPQKNKRPRSWNLLASVGLDHNRTNTFDENGEALQTSRQRGARWQVGAAYRGTHWGVEAGVAYANRRYQTGKEVFTIRQNSVDGTAIGTSFESVSAQLVQVPVRVTRQVARMGRTRVVAVAGATGHLAAQKNYQFSEHVYPTVPGTSGNNQPDIPQPDGLLQGGSVNRNFYATADLGVRVERPVTRGTTAFIESSVSQPVAGAGYGPARARTRTVGVSAGVLAAL